MTFAKYLGRNEKNGFIQLVALQAATENVLREIEQTKGADKTYLRYLRTGRSWLEKAIDLRISNLDPDAALDFAKHIKRVDPVVFISSNEAKKEFAEIEKMGNTLHMTLDDFQDLYCELIESLCKTCTRCDFKACVLYKILLKYDIVAVSDGIRSCPYSYSESQQELSAMQKQNEKRRVEEEMSVLVRAEKKLEEIIAERDELKSKLTQNEIEMCKVEGTVCRLKSDVTKKEDEIQKAKNALRASERAYNKQKDRLAMVDMDNKKIVAQNEKLRAKITKLKEAAKRFAEGVVRDAGD